MNCLQNYIGVRGCDQTAPLSGLWLNDWPGLSNELFDSIATPDQVSYLGLIASVKRTAYEALKSDLQTVLYEFGQTNMDQILFQTRRPFVQERQQIRVMEASEQWRGAYVSLSGSKFLGFRLNSILVYNSGSAVNDVPWKVFQCQDGTTAQTNEGHIDSVLLEGTANLVPGMNFIPVNEVLTPTFDKFNLLVMVDCSNVDTLRGQFTDWNFGWNLDCSCYQRWMFTVKGWYLWPATAELDYGLGSRFTNAANQSGVYFDADLICSMDTLICRNKELLKMAWGNKLAATILMHKLAGNRQNFPATYNEEQTNKTLATFLADYQENLKVWARVANLANEDLCFDCEDSQVIKHGALRV